MYGSVAEGGGRVGVRVRDIMRSPVRLGVVDAGIGFQGSHTIQLFCDQGVRARVRIGIRVRVGVRSL